MSIKEKAEQYARDAWGEFYNDTTAYGTNMSVGEMSAIDFTAGYNEAMAQPKHIFDGAAVAGEVRRFEGELVDVVDDDETCRGCILNDRMPICDHLTDCDINNVKYIKR